MKRERGFKAKNIKRNGVLDKWVFGYYVKTQFYPKGYVADYIVTENDTRYEIDKDTLCQYTGLKDKDGNNIFEGDILLDDTIAYKVIFKDGCFLLDIDGEFYLVARLVDEGYCIVIGNIHDNPELIKS